MHLGTNYTTSEVPDAFCWTRYGTEAGEDAASIIDRKEAERQANGGVFLWGIGNSVGPSVRVLLRETARPRVVFTPMLSTAAAHDVAPANVAIWFGGIGLEGRPYEIPAHSLVTSRISSAGRPHYALVCRSDDPLTIIRARDAFFTADHVQNVRSGSRVGASQVTSVVRRIACAFRWTPSSYEITFMADLVAPYVVRLTEYQLAPGRSSTGRRLQPGGGAGK